MASSLEVLLLLLLINAYAAGQQGTNLIEVVYYERITLQLLHFFSFLKSSCLKNIMNLFSRNITSTSSLDGSPYTSRGKIQVIYLEHKWIFLFRKVHYDFMVRNSEKRVNIYLKKKLFISMIVCDKSVLL